MVALFRRALLVLQAAVDHVLRPIKLEAQELADKVMQEARESIQCLVLVAVVLARKAVILLGRMLAQQVVMVKFRR